MPAPLLRVAELVYTNVTAGYSPAGHRGYQTVCASPGLSPGDRQRIEESLGGMPDVEVGVPRWQWLRWPDGRALLARSQFVPPDPEITDPRGAVLAHALVLTAGDVTRLRDNPFPLIDRFPFVSTPREMVSRFGQAQGVAPETEDAFEPVPPAVAGWTGPGILALARLGGEAGATLQAGRSILLQGRPQAIVDALRLLFHLTPPAALRHCTFNTLARPADARPGSLWAVGFSDSRPPAVDWVLLDAEQRTIVPSGAPASGRPDSPYLCWLGTRLTAAPSPQLEACLCQAPLVQQLTGALEDGIPPDAGLAQHPEAAALVEAAAPVELRARLAERVGAWVGPEAGPACTRWIDARLTAEQRLSLAVGWTDRPAEAASWCSEWLLAATPTLSGRSLGRLSELASDAANDLLALLVAVWPGAPVSDDRHHLVATATPEAYRRALTLCPDIVSPEILAVARHAPLLLEHLATTGVKAAPLLACIEALLADRYPGPFISLIPCLDRLDRWQLRRLLRLPRDPWRHDPEFANMLADAYQAREQAEPWWNRSVAWPRDPRLTRRPRE